MLRGLHPSFCSFILKVRPRNEFTRFFVLGYLITMRNKSRLDRVFAQLLQHHPYGWALYKKATTRDVHPGCCGYFDTDGDWHTLVDLMSSDEDLTQKGWKSPSDSFNSRDEEPQTLIWGPKTSKTVVSRQLGGEAGAP